MEIVRKSFRNFFSIARLQQKIVENEIDIFNRQ